MYKDFCEERYNEIYCSIYEQNITGKKSKNAVKNAELVAQREGIYQTFCEAVAKYSNTISLEKIWNSIYSTHLKRKANLVDFSDLSEINEEVISGIISAAQSWKKCSGHVFERFIVEQTKDRLASYGIRLILQKELTSLIHSNEIANDNTDMEWLRNTTESEDFDIFALITVNRKNYVFGCVQSKTSIRDRVGRDRDFSIPAMDKHLWSVAVTLDGSFLSLPKFEHMVNGGGKSQYESNGWHGMYAMSNASNKDRIYFDDNFNILIEHAQLASSKFISARQRFTKYWNATNPNE